MCRVKRTRDSSTNGPLYSFRSNRGPCFPSFPLIIIATKNTSAEALSYIVREPKRAGRSECNHSIVVLLSSFPRHRLVITLIS